MSEPSPAQRRFFIALLLGSMAVIAAMLVHLGPALLVATVLAVLLWPLQTRLQKKLKDRRSLVALMLTGAVVVLVVTPVVAMSAFVVREVTGGIRYVTTTVESEGMSGLVDKLPTPLRSAGHTLIQAIPKEQVGAQSAPAAAAVGSAVLKTGSAIFQLAMAVVALFFFLSRGEQCLDWLDHASPLRRGQTRELLYEVKQVSYSVIVSSFLTAGLQAVAAFIGYLIARVPNIAFFTAVTFVCALIPAVGATIVCVIAAALLLAQGHTAGAIFLAIWGVVIVGIVDNVVRPYLIKGRATLNGAVVFFSLIGGIGAFGATGLLIGPLSVALFLALLRMYHRDFSGKGDDALSEAPSDTLEETADHPAQPH
jgi:predicted PurR-regulated permease PerM